MLVLNTTSPATSPSAPKEYPMNVVPFSKASIAFKWMVLPRLMFSGPEHHLVANLAKVKKPSQGQGHCLRLYVRRARIQRRNQEFRQFIESEHRTDVYRIAEEGIPEERNCRDITFNQTRNRRRVRDLR